METKPNLMSLTIDKKTKNSADMVIRYYVFIIH